MRLGELWNVSPQCFIFIRNKNQVFEYTGESRYKSSVVTTVLATSSPMYEHVLEVTLEDQAAG